MQDSTDPIAALVEHGGVLAVIAGTEGPSYRTVGTMMACLPSGQTIGSLSSGCIEADVVRHAEQVIETGGSKILRYGRGSPYRDISLPCGGGLDILLVPNPDVTALSDILARRQARENFSISISLSGNMITVSNRAEAAPNCDMLVLHESPALQVLAIGQGPEVTTFARLCHQVPFATTVLSPDDTALRHTASLGCAAHQLVSPILPADLLIDADTAAVLFFHDHDWEPPLLHELLRTDAFYLGAQGSHLARQSRNQDLQVFGNTEKDLARIKAPVGLIKSARDPQTLAISVLAEIVSLHKSAP
ncbi:MAG: XdhC family protein [Pseudomonadota bacterium]